MHFGLGFRQAVDGLRLRLRRGAVLLLLPVVVGLVGDHPERGEAAVGDRLAAELARLLVSQQQADGAGRQGSAAGAGSRLPSCPPPLAPGLPPDLFCNISCPDLSNWSSKPRVFMRNLQDVR